MTVESPARCSVTLGSKAVSTLLPPPLPPTVLPPDVAPAAPPPPATLTPPELAAPALAPAADGPPLTPPEPAVLVAAEPLVPLGPEPAVPAEAPALGVTGTPPLPSSATPSGEGAPEQPKKAATKAARDHRFRQGVTHGQEGRTAENRFRNKRLRPRRASGPLRARAGPGPKSAPDLSARATRARAARSPARPAGRVAARWRR